MDYSKPEPRGALGRRDFLRAASAAMVSSALPVPGAPGRARVFVGSGAKQGVLAFDWDGGAGELSPAGVAADIPTVDWLAWSPDRRYLFAACEVDSFAGRPTGEVASFRVEGGALKPLSAVNSASRGTCHLALDRSGRVLLAADYGGGSAASFLVTAGRLSPAVWTEHYTEHGPNPVRQESAHAHFCSFSPDNRFAYINDLGGDRIHIYRLDPATARLTPAGAYHARPGSGPRTLHFHPNGRTAYAMNELDSSVDVVAWSPSDGSLVRRATVNLLEDGSSHEGQTGCDTVITRDGRFVYFANRGTDFIFALRADPATGELTPMRRTGSGGRTPRNFVLDPTERWMLVANQNSDRITVFARDPGTGELQGEGRSFSARTPMRILFS